MRRFSPLVATTLLLLHGCGPPDTKALQKLACEQASTSLDMQSVAQIDALRKALGVAPGVDPIQHCRSIGAEIDSAPDGESGDGNNGAKPERTAPPN